LLKPFYHVDDRKPVLQRVKGLVGKLIACCHQPKKPSLALDLPQVEAIIPN
jgi:hypothetical protein